MRVTIPTTLVPYQFRLTKFVAFGSDVAGLVGWTIRKCGVGWKNGLNFNKLSA
jgi:hypothetical protein